MHVSASSACVALVAALMVSSVSAAGGTAGKLDEYSCDDMCGGCKIKNAASTTVNGYAARGTLTLDKANANADAATAYCLQGTLNGGGAGTTLVDGWQPTAGEYTFYRECAKKGTTAGSGVATDERNVFTIDQYSADACTGTVHRTSFVEGACYKATDKQYVHTSWASATAYWFTGTSATDIKMFGNTAGHCGTTNRIDATGTSIVATCGAGTDATSDKRAKLATGTLNGNGFLATQAVVRDIYEYVGSSTAASACGNVPTSVVTTPTQGALSVSTAAHTASMWVVDTTNGQLWVHNLYPRGTCFGAQGAKYMWICPAGTSTPASTDDSSADSTAAATTTAAPVVTTTAAAATTTAAASSASAVSAIAAFAAAVLCVVA